MDAAWIFVVLCCVSGGWCGDVKYEDGSGDNEKVKIVSHAADWTHLGDHGVDHWAEMFATCDGSSQSPININTEKTNSVFVYDEKLTNDLDIVKGKDAENFYVSNNGHAVSIDVSEAELSVVGANLGRTYKVLGPHWHWGEKNSRGSEHTFNGIQYPLEMHIVTWDSETYPDPKDAIGSNVPGALAVVGVMFQLADEDNSALEPILEKFGQIQHPDKTNKIAIPAFDLKNLLPAERSEYFRYAGSLTTPTCNEVVTWTVLLHPQPVSQRQLDIFRGLHGAGEDAQGNMPALVDNFRPVQPLNGRKVYKSFQEPSIDLPNAVKNPKKRVDDEHSSAATRPVIGHFIAAVATVVALVLLH